MKHLPFLCLADPIGLPMTSLATLEALRQWRLPWGGHVAAGSAPGTVTVTGIGGISGGTCGVLAVHVFHVGVSSGTCGDGQGSLRGLAGEVTTLPLALNAVGDRPAL